MALPNTEYNIPFSDMKLDFNAGYSWEELKHFYGRKVFGYTYVLYRTVKHVKYLLL